MTKQRQIDKDILSTRKNLSDGLAKEFSKAQKLPLGAITEMNERILQAFTDQLNAVESAHSSLMAKMSMAALAIRDVSNTHHEELHALVGQVSSIVGGLKEIQEWFLGDTYETEIARLATFVDLCERLQALKECGFLDSMADTMLMLSDGRKAD